MKPIRLLLTLLVIFILVLSACSALETLPTPTAAPLPPPQFLEGALQWLQTNALMHNQVDWDALRSEIPTLVPDPQTTADTYPAICLALRQLKDGNAWMLVPDLEIPNFYTGYYALYPEYKVIIGIDPNSPAEKAGVHVGDIIEDINGHPPISYADTDGYPPCNAKEIDTSTEEHLVINRNGQSIQIIVERTKITSGENPYYPPLGKRLGPDASGIGYIEMTLESGAHLEYPGEVQKLMKSMDKAPVCGWVIDLRRNFGGDIWSYIAALGPLVGEGDLGGFEYTDGKRELWAYRNGEVFWNNEYRDESEIDGSIYKPKRVTPVALLISPATQAAAELLLISFHGRADVHSFGEPTRGLPTLVTHTQLSDGSSIFVSGAFSFDRNGKTYNGPISPDVRVATNWSQFGTDQDPVILAAMDWLQSQSACLP